MWDRHELAANRLNIPFRRADPSGSIGVMDQDQIWDHYQNVATGTFTESHGRNAFLARQVAAGSKVLNIGAGVLIFEKLAREQGAEVHCLDPSAASISRAQKELGLGERAKVGHSQSIPFADAQFDLVVMSEVLEHLTSDDLNRSLVEVARVLKPGGIFLGTVPFDEDLAASAVVCPHCSKSFHRWGHQQHFTKESLQALLCKSFTSASCTRKKFVTWQARSFLAKLVAVAKLTAHALGARIPDESLYFRAWK